MNSDDALKLAERDGAIVRPKLHEWLAYFFEAGRLCVRYITDDGMNGFVETIRQIPENKKTDSNGAPMEWEVAT